MLNIEAQFIQTYSEAVASSVNALLPLMGATIGIFLAFAIANSVRFFIQKTVK